MKSFNWQVLLGATLLLLSILVYILHYLIFKDLHHILIFLVEDIAFVFVEVLLVTLIIHRVLQEREKKERLEKLNMVIGAFFSEVGIGLLRLISGWDNQSETIEAALDTRQDTASEGYRKLCEYLKKHSFQIDQKKAELTKLKKFLVPKRDFLLRLLENPNLLEHGAFTDVLWAVFHLTEELEARETFDGLPASDSTHLCGDAGRVYGQLSRQWLNYMQHLEAAYPYLFSLSLRKNPFDRNASPIVQGPL